MIRLDLQDDLMNAIDRQDVVAFSTTLERGADLNQETFWKGMLDVPARAMFRQAALMGSAKLLEVASGTSYNIASGLQSYVPLDTLLGKCGTSPGDAFLAFVLKHHPGDWRAYRDREGDSLLHLFVKDNRWKQIEALVKAGADPNARNAKGQTPAFFAQKALDLSMLQSKNEVDLLACDNQGRSVLRHLSDELQRHVEKGRRKPQSENGAIIRIIEVMAIVCATHPMINDRHGRVIARRVYRLRYDKAMDIGTDSPKFSLLVSQADQVMSQFRRDQLKGMASKIRRAPTPGRAL